jgi:hypothetical protein
MTFNFLLVLFNDRRGKVVFHVVHKVFLNGLVQWFLITEYGTDIVAFVANNFRSATFWQPAASIVTTAFLFQFNPEDRESQ